MNINIFVDLLTGKSILIVYAENIGYHIYKYKW